MTKPIIRRIVVDAALLADPAWVQALAEERVKHNTAVRVYSAAGTFNMDDYLLTHVLPLDSTAVKKASHVTPLEINLQNTIPGDHGNNVLLLTNDKAVIKNAEVLGIQTRKCKSIDDFRSALSLSNVEGLLQQIMQLIKDNQEELNKLPRRSAEKLKEMKDDDLTITERTQDIAAKVLRGYDTFLTGNHTDLTGFTTELGEVSKELKNIRQQYNNTGKNDGFWLENMPRPARIIIGALLTLTIIAPVLGALIDWKGYKQAFFYQKPEFTADQATKVLDNAVNQLNDLITDVKGKHIHFADPEKSAQAEAQEQPQPPV